MKSIRLPIATTLAAALIATPAMAYADCGQDGQPACTGPVPTVDQVTALLTELMDPNKPNADKNDVVTPDLSPDNVGFLDKYSGALDSKGDWPYDFIVTDIQPAPNNFAGATVATRANGHADTSNPTAIVLVNQSGHWLIDRKAALLYVFQVFASFYPHKHFGGI
jgi:hypothetical protein